MRAPLGRAIVTFPYMRMKAKHPAYPLPARRRRRRRLLRIALLLLAFNLVIPPYIRPAQGAVTSRFFLRTRPETANPLALEVHKGIDFAAPRGSPVRAAKSGIVDTVGSSPTLGTYVIIRHWLGFSTLYAHLDSARTRAGRPVVKWARIGSAGQSGRATGPHLHFEVRWLGRRLPPGPFLAIDSARRALWRLFRPGQR